LNKYEGIFIIRPNLTEENSKAVLDLIENEIKKNEGEVETINSWGRKNLAYAVKKFTEGLYYQIDFSIAPSALKDMDRKFRLNDDILRHMMIRKETQ